MDILSPDPPPILLTMRAHERNMKFVLTCWAVTFPVGTCFSGTAQLAHHTGLPLFAWASFLFYVGLLAAWPGSWPPSARPKA